MAVNYQRLLRRLDKKLNESKAAEVSNTSTSYSQNGSGNIFYQKLSKIMLHHRNNLANPQQFKDSSDK